MHHRVMEWAVPYWYAAVPAELDYKRLYAKQPIDFDLKPIKKVLYNAKQWIERGVTREDLLVERTVWLHHAEGYKLTPIDYSVLISDLRVQPWEYCPMMEHPRRLWYLFTEQYMPRIVIASEIYHGPAVAEAICN